MARAAENYVAGDGAPALDALDHSILEALQRDAKASSRDLAASLRVAQSTVVARIRRLTRSGVLRFYVATDMRAGGYPLLLLAGIRARKRQVEEVGRRLAQIPEAVNVMVVTGDFDLSARFLMRDTAHLVSVLEGKLGAIDGIEGLEFDLGLEVHRYGGAYRPTLKTAGPSLPVLGLDEVDEAIVRALRADARANLTQIAKRCGVSEGTIRFRVRRLEERRLIRYLADIDPEALGARAMAFVGLFVDYPRLTQVTQSVLKIPEITSVMKTMGSMNLLAVAAVRDRHDLSSLLTQRLGRLPGFRRSVTTEILSVIKHDRCWTEIH